MDTLACTATPSQVSAKKVGVSLWPHYHIFNAFLIFLFCLHLFWCALRHPRHTAPPKGTEGHGGVVSHPAFTWTREAMIMFVADGWP